MRPAELATCVLWRLGVVLERGKAGACGLLGGEVTGALGLCWLQDAGKRTVLFVVDGPGPEGDSVIARTGPRRVEVTSDGARLRYE
jgi:hypothetical protein